MSSVLVIDARSRNLTAFVASATKANDVGGADQLVLRFSLGLGEFAELMKKNPDGFRAEMPVLIMGSFSAMSSAGHTATVAADNGDGHRKVIVVGGLGAPFGGGRLKVLTRPISGTLVEGPARITRLPGAGNSNTASADAAWEGVKLLAEIDRRGAFLVEGQSDYTAIWRFGFDSANSYGDEMGAIPPRTEFPAEHRGEMFSFPNIIRRMVFGAAAGQVRYRHRNEEEFKPSSEEIGTLVKQRFEGYFEEVRAGDTKALARLGNNHLFDLPWKATEDGLRELYASLASTPVEEAPKSPAAIAADEDEYVEVEE